MDVVTRRATADDLTRIAQILKRYGLPLDGISDHLGTALVACSNAIVIGCAALEVYNKAALLRSVAVDPAYRGERVGQSLTRAALELASQFGVGEVYLLTTTAEEYFSDFGFQRIGRVEVPEEVRQSLEFKGACPETATVMRRPL